MMWNCRAREVLGRHAKDFLVGLMIVVLVYFLGAINPRAAHPAEAETGPAAASRAGTLHMPGSGSEALSSDVRISVTGGLVHAVVSQSFRHQGPASASGLYMFPLPEAATVSRFEVRVGERSYRSRVVSTLDKPAQAAQVAAGTPAPVTVSTAAAAADSPGLPGDMPSHMFALAIGDVAPGEVVSVRFEYQQEVKPVAGVYSLRFPLSSGAPAGEPTKDAARDVSLSVRLAPGFEIGDIGSFNHQMTVRRLSDSDAVLVLTGDTIPAGRDFELAWAPKPAPKPSASLFLQEMGQQVYGLAVIAPPAQVSTQPRELVLLVDASGSMAGTAFDQARDVAIAALGRLNRHDRFNIIAFNDGLHALFEQARDANPTSVAAAADFLRRLQPHGGGNMLAAVTAALRNAGEGAHLRQVVTITDGAISTGNEFFAEIAARRGGSRLFFAGIGAAPEPLLLQRAAQIGRGDAVLIPDRAQTGELLASLFSRIERPAITGLKVVPPEGAGKLDMSPEPLPDVYAGDPLTAVFRMPAGKGRIVFTGQSDGKPWKAELPLAAARPASGISAYWAQTQIARIEAQRLTGKPARETAEAIEQLALANNLPSAVTRLTAVRSDADVAGNRAIAVRHGLRAPGNGIDLRKQVIAARANVAQAVESPQVMQAGPARSSYLNVFALALVFGGMTALTHALWRHLRRSHAPAEPRRRVSREWRDQVR
ncbi:MAG: VWA domain-containing protein [Hyphomicrobiales bacterium]